MVKMNNHHSPSNYWRPLLQEHVSAIMLWLLVGCSEVPRVSLRQCEALHCSRVMHTQLKETQI